MKLPVKYHLLNSTKKKEVREEYIKIQNGKCWFCLSDLRSEPPQIVTERPINLKLFPPRFLSNPIHLQHDHQSGLTEGAVHAYCNAVLWQYYNR